MYARRAALRRCVLQRISCFAICTARSASPLLCANLGLDVQCANPEREANSAHSWDANCGPMSRVVGSYIIGYCQNKKQQKEVHAWLYTYIVLQWYGHEGTAVHGLER